MFKESLVIGLFSETALHPGTGTTTGVIDLPVQREAHTNFPIIQSAGLKGAMRELGENKRGKGSNEVKVIFGHEKAEHAGSIAVTDAKLIAFPVRSLSYVYLWVTCPQVLSRYVRDMALLGKTVSHKIPVTPAGKALVSPTSKLNGKVVLEEMIFDIDKQEEDIDKWIGEIIQLMPDSAAHTSTIEKMNKHLVVIPDSDFEYFVTSSTQVSARIKLKDNKTNENLWYEETLPPDCLFYSMLLVMDPRMEKPLDGLSNAEKITEKLEELLNTYIQIGGNETTGMGWCAIKLLKEDKNNE